MKKKWWILIIIIVMIILVFPIKKVYRDGGTVEYSAVLYKVIKWNRIRKYEENKTGTEVYFFPKNLHSLEYYDDPRPDAIAFHGENGLVVANTGTYSWSKDVDGTNLLLIVDTVGPLGMEYKNTLKITQGGSIKSDVLILNITKITTYKYDGDQAKEIENELEYDEKTQIIDMSKLDKGTYIIDLYVVRGINKVSYSIKVEILDEGELEAVEENEDNSQTFYAEIKNINGANLLVDGLDVNDINYRGEFSFKIDEETKLEWRNTTIDISDFDEGDNISITFEGSIQETYPAKISDVVKIQLLDDEK